MGDPADRTQYLAGEIVQCHLWFPPQVVTVIINLTPILDGTGPSRLLDIVEGRSKQTFKQWLAEPHQVWRDAVEVVAMDDFTGSSRLGVEVASGPGSEGLVALG